MAKGRLYKPRAFALGLLYHIKNTWVYMMNEKRGILRGAPFFRSAIPSFSRSFCYFFTISCSFSIFCCTFATY